MRTRRFQPGFTLLELVLVMMIIATAMAITAPRLTGWNRGRELRNSADEFVALTHLARTEAITNGARYRIQFEAEAGRYQIKKLQGTQWVQLPQAVGRVYTAPQGGKILLEVYKTGIEQQTADTLECIDFYPTGRTQPARVTISDRAGTIIVIGCESATDEFRLIETSSS